MLYDSQTAQREAVLQAAYDMCAAARTAPKTCGKDKVLACIVTDAEKDAIANEMRTLAEQLNYGFFVRDAGNVDAAQAMVLIGTEKSYRALGEGCAFCNNPGGCKECAQKDGVCVYDPMDLGIALGSAVSIAADRRIDNRLMFSAGRAAMEMGSFFDGKATMIIGIPLSVSGKSPFFDRK